MRVIVDRDVCTGCGLCADIWPEVFAMEGDTARVICEHLPSDAEESHREMIDNCLIDAISINK
jgi:ferredoxin